MSTATATSADAATADKNMTSKDYYFDSYAHFGIHEEMLKDSVRTLAYRDAILQNKHLFKGKVVLDVGCGTGILSMFAATAGAAHVYGVDMSSIIDQAKLIVAENNLSDRVTLIKGKVEEIDLPVEKVDIIISEWMGYFLLYESMLDTVLVARDRWLKPDGLLFPDRAVMCIAALEDGQYREEKIDFWDNVYGFKMSAIKDAALHEPLVDTADDKNIVSSVCDFKEIDIKTIRKEELTFDEAFALEIERNDYAHAFIVWFDISFSCCHKPVNFSTSPYSKYTHWKQTIFYTPDPMRVSQGDKIIGRIACRPNTENPRDLDIDVSYEQTNSQGAAQQESITVHYKMR